MKLTKKKAIKITIELWEWLVETGERKGGWEGWKKYGTMEASCPLCEYVDGEACESKCPLLTKLGKGCDEMAYPDWNRAALPKTRKKYAKLFLEELRRL